ncbi:MAG: Nif3-like dinuclear metal center hexameric protein [Defluviitaleaceae bacterium]|nr:Nif3-like dinuclear metal center hexameric protein [Defluviitaleaceae bacterium]
MCTVNNIIEAMEKWAPLSLAEEWDNCGLLIGDCHAPAKKILVALDVTEAVISEAVDGEFDFIISHHPLIYNPVKNISAADILGRKILTLIKHGIGCYAAHTNLDKAIGGVNDCLAEKLNLQNTSPLVEEEWGVGIGRVGELSQEVTLHDFIDYVKNVLNLPEIRFSGNPHHIIKTVGLCGGDGSGGRYVRAAVDKKCDVYITGDFRYHSAQEAKDLGLNILDITHYSSEVLVIDAIVNRLRPLGINIHGTKTIGQVLFTM